MFICFYEFVKYLRFVNKQWKFYSDYNSFWLDINSLAILGRALLLIYVSVIMRAVAKYVSAYNLNIQGDS